MARVLIVDDNQTMAEMLSLTLETHGHDSIVAYSGEDALEMIPILAPDIVLLDIMMPEMDGFETLRRLRRTPRGRYLPVIIVTAGEQEDLEERVRQAGGDGFLRKPVSSAALAALVEKYTQGAERRSTGPDEGNTPGATPIEGSG